VPLDKRQFLIKLRIGGAVFLLLVILFKLLFNFSYPDAPKSFKRLLPNFIENKVKLFQQEVIKKLNFLLPEPYLSIIKSLLFGGKHNLPFQLKELIRYSGLSHLVAVSGLHLAILLQIWLYFFNVWPIPKLIKFIILALIIISYIIMADFSPSILRAAIMSLIMIFALLNHRQYYSFWSLIMSVLILSAINPQILKDIGFQLSVLSTLGIIKIYPLVSQKHREQDILLGNNLLISLTSLLKESFLLCFSALIMVLPLTFYYFHEFSFFTPLTNVLIVPLVPLIIILSLLVIILSFICYPLAFLFSWFLKLLLDYFLFVINVFGNLKIARIFIAQMPLSILLIYYFLVFLFIIYQQKQIKFTVYE